MQQTPKILYRFTSLTDRSVRVHHVLRRPSRDQVVRIDQWFMWAQGYLPEDSVLTDHIKFVKCDTTLSFLAETPVATSFIWEGPHWNDKAQHRIQKDFAKGGVERIVEQQNSWRIIETQLWINAPFRVDVVDYLNNNIVCKTDVSYKGQIRA